MSSNNDAIQNHNIELHNTEGRIIKLQNNIEDSLSNNKQINSLSVKINLKAGAYIIQQNRRPIAIHFQDQVAQELKRLIKQSYVERRTEITEDCFVSTAVITMKKDKSVKFAPDSRKLNEITVKRKAQMPNMEELISRMSRKNSEGSDVEILATKLDLIFRLCIRTNQARRKYKKRMHNYRNGRRFYKILPFPERLSRTGRFSIKIPRTDRHNTAAQTPGLAR